MDTTSIILAIIGAILGSAGLFSFLQYLISRHDKKNDKLAVVLARLDKGEKVQHETVLRVTRLELNNLIHDDPDNVEAIVQVAKYYFIDLDGNAYAHAKFEQWAGEHNVPTNWLPSMIKKK